MLCLSQFLILGAIFAGAALTEPTWSNNETGISAFYSRPDIRPQILHVTTYEPNLVAPGYFFTAPYHFLIEYKDRFTPGQPGPHIYGQQGELIWSGASKLNGGGAAFDFRPARYNGSNHLSFVHFRRQGYVLMDDSYNVVKAFKPHGDLLDDLHEFQILDGSNRALLTTVSRQPANKSVLNEASDQMVISHGFQEMDLETEDVLFEWTSIDHIPLSDGYVTELEGDGYLDFAHTNSVQKTPEGDYIVSGRHTSAVYKISGKDGSTIWQLGGRRSTFDLKNFQLAYQHDARLHEETDTHMILSLFNNGADDRKQILDHSSALLLRLDKITMTAEEIGRWDRPDGKVSTHRGNVQLLSNGNVFVCWSAGGYASEFTRDGRLVQEIYFQTDRMGTYRAYKSEFRANPRERPTMKAFVEITPSGSQATAFFASWNGATDVSSWNFYSVDAENQITLLGNVLKGGFESVFVTEGHFMFATAEAVSSNGTSLGNSTIEISQPVPEIVPRAFPIHKKPRKLLWTWSKDFSVEIVEVAFASSVLGALLMTLFLRSRRKVLPSALFAIYSKSVRWNRRPNMEPWLP